MKRLDMFLTSPGQADPARQPLGRTVCWLENPRPAPFPLQQSSTRPGHQVPVSTRTVCRILSRNGLHGQISAQKPALNKRQLKNRVLWELRQELRPRPFPCLQVQQNVQANCSALMSRAATPANNYLCLQEPTRSGTQRRNILAIRVVIPAVLSKRTFCLSVKLFRRVH